jgi:hypothetical protein
MLRYARTMLSNVAVTGHFARLMLEDSVRGRNTYRLQERSRGTLLLDDKAYSWSRR